MTIRTSSVVTRPSSIISSSLGSTASIFSGRSTAVITTGRSPERSRILAVCICLCAVAFDTVHHRSPQDTLLVQEFDDCQVQWLTPVLVGVADVYGQLRCPGRFHHVPPRARPSTTPRYTAISPATTWPSVLNAAASSFESTVLDELQGLVSVGRESRIASQDADCQEGPRPGGK